ncbi:unnamed protein product, partial [Laminaria digitata]
IKSKYYKKARTEAKGKRTIAWGPEEHQKLFEGEPAGLRSRTKITAEMILAIGLPDLTQEALPGQVVLAEEAKKEAEQQAKLEAAAAEAAAEAAERAEEAGEGEHAEDSVHEPVEAPEPVAPPLPLPPPEALPPVRTQSQDDPTKRRLDIASVIEHCLMPPLDKYEAHKRLAMITRNLQALGVLDSRGKQVDGWMIGD